jgi:hypothetical protein
VKARERSHNLLKYEKEGRESEEEVLEEKEQEEAGEL